MNVFQRLGRALRPKMNYDAAKAKRRLAGWRPSTASARATMASDGAQMRDRARDLMRNNPYAASAADSFVANCIGSGIKPSSLIGDRDARRAMMELWKDWTDEADADGLFDFYGLQALVTRALFEAGEAFVRFRPRRMDEMETVPLQLQVLESDMLDFGLNEIADNGNPIVNGIEIDFRGKRVAYHFFTRHPGDATIETRNPALAENRVRVPASEVLHVANIRRPGQMRGAPVVAPSIVKLWLLDQYDDAELDRKKTAAMYAGFITTPEGEDFIEPGDIDPAADDAVTLEPGLMQFLKPGEDVRFSEPADVGGGYEAFQYRNLLAAFSGMGVPYTTGTGDLKRANYSSLRGAIVEYRRRIEQLQFHVVAFQLCRPVWRRWLADAVLSGALAVPGYALAPRIAARVKWIAPRWEWVDPLKDVNAEIAAVEAGFKARSDVIEGLGEDPEETDARIAADKAREEALGLSFASDAPSPADVLLSPGRGDPPEREQDDDADNQDEPDADDARAA